MKARKLSFTPRAKEEYEHWVNSDPKILNKINNLIAVICETPFTGIGKPEKLKYDLAGYLSRRINLEHRLVYRVSKDEIIIISCWFHYD